jgi:hypothetical protein
MAAFTFEKEDPRRHEFIKDLLGHFNIKTTERYLHVSKEKLVNIVSPFDDLWKKEDIDW